MTDERKEGGLALFDMDGTLLPWDTQYVFSCFVVQRHPWRRLLLLFYLACLPLFFLGIWDETRMKRAFLCYLWRLPPETVLQYGREFAELADAWVYPELRERLQRHRNSGDACIMVMIGGRSMKYCVMQHALSGWKAIMISGLNFRMAGEIWQALA